MIERLRILAAQFLRRGGLAREALVYGLSDIGSRAITAIGGVVIARLYLPADIGAFSTIAAASNLIAFISTWRYDLAVPLPRSRPRASGVVEAAYFSMAITLTVVAIAILALQCFGATDFLSALRPGAAAINSNMLWWIPFLVAAYASGLVAQGWLLRNDARLRFGIVRLSQSMVTVGLSALGGVFSLGFLGLIAGEVLGKACSLLAFVGRLRPSTQALVKRLARLPGGHMRSRYLVRLSVISSTMLRYRAIALFTTPSGLINQFLELAPTIFLAFQFGPAAAAQWALLQLGLRVLGTPAQAVGAPFYRRFALLHRQQSPQAPKLFFDALGVLLAISLPGAIVMLVAAPQIYEFVFGARWIAAGALLQILALPACINQVGTIWPMIAVIGAQRTQLVLSFVSVALAVAIAGLSRHLGWSFQSTAIALNLCQTFQYAMMLAVCYRWTRARQKVETDAEFRRP